MDQQIQPQEDQPGRYMPPIKPSWRLFVGRHAPSGQEHVHCFRCALVFWGPDRESIRAQHERSAHSIR